MRSERLMHLGRTCDRSLVSNQILRFRCRGCRLNLINHSLEPRTTTTSDESKAIEETQFPINGDDFPAQTTISPAKRTVSAGVSFIKPFEGPSDARKHRPTFAVVPDQNPYKTNADSNRKSCFVSSTCRYARLM